MSSERGFSRAFWGGAPEASSLAPIYRGEGFGRGRGARMMTVSGG